MKITGYFVWFPSNWVCLMFCMIRLHTFSCNTKQWGCVYPGAACEVAHHFYLSHYLCFPLITWCTKKSKVSYQDMRSFYQSIIDSIINNKYFIFSIDIIRHWLAKMTSQGLAAVRVWHLGTAVLHDPWSSLSVLVFCEPKIDRERIGTRVKPTAVVLAWGHVVWLWPEVRDQPMDLRKGVNHCASIYWAPPMSWEAATGAAKKKY